MKKWKSLTSSFVSVKEEEMAYAFKNSTQKTAKVTKHYCIKIQLLSNANFSHTHPPVCLLV